MDNNGGPEIRNTWSKFINKISAPFRSEKLKNLSGKVLALFSTAKRRAITIAVIGAVAAGSITAAVLAASPPLPADEDIGAAVTEETAEAEASAEPVAEDEVVKEVLDEKEILEGQNLFGDIWEEEAEETPADRNDKKSRSGSGKNAAQPGAAAVKQEEAPLAGKDTYLVYVSKNSYTIAILGLDDNGEYTKVVRCFSTGIGRSSAQTRTGTFEITGKQRWHAWGRGGYSPYAVKYSGGVYIHGPIYSEKDSNTMQPGSYNEIGTSCSSGCLRTTCSAAAWVYYNCPVGTKVVVANDSRYSAGRPGQIPPSQRYDPTDPGASPEIPVTSFALNKTNVTIKEGGSFNIDPINIQPADTSTNDFLYTCDNTAVATVSDDGVITAVSAGTARITVAANDPYGKTLYCTVTVTPAEIPVTSIKLNKNSISLQAEKTFDLKVASYTPKDTTTKGFTYASSNNNIAVVNSSGRITAKTAGTVNITVTANDSRKLSAVCKVTVTPAETPVTAVTLSDMSLTAGSEGKITVSYQPADAANTSFIYYSSDTSVATVDQEGNITALKAGETIITVTANDEGKASATCRITVTDPEVYVTSFTLSQTSVSLAEGETTIITVSSYLPGNATKKDFTYFSSNTAVATVDNNGNITAVAAGDAVITVIANGDDSISETCSVSVSAPAQGGDTP